MKNDALICGFCGGSIPEDIAMDIYQVDDDKGWEMLAKYHVLDCEWVLTRAHRLSYKEYGVWN